MWMRFVWVNVKWKLGKRWSFSGREDDLLRLAVVFFAIHLKARARVVAELDAVVFGLCRGFVCVSQKY